LKDRDGHPAWAEKNDLKFMRRLAFILILLLTAPCLRAEDQTVSVSDIIQSVQQYAQDNLDTNVFKDLPQVDDEQAQKFLHDMETQFQGDYVVDLAALRQTAQAVMPLLASQEDTQPYAAWLKSQMAYLEVADEIHLTNSPPAATTNQTPVLRINPSPQKERELWTKKMSAEPWPDGAKQYVPQLKPIFIAQKVPAELVWLAEVESSFDRRAESPAGAAGLFQLMPDTAKRFGLSLWPFDQRFQPQPSATASAQYLKKLHDHFGDWRLALAAYNAGEGRVQKLLTRYKTNNYDDIASHLPAETQMYVPRVEAVIKQREGANLEDL
jgi:membrane-bound lytic murein transglycosylase D